MSSMRIDNERGMINVLLIPLIIAVTLLLGSLGFGAWAYMSRQDYKYNSDEKSDAAVEVAVERTKTEKDNEFLEREKEPLREYIGPAALGGMTVKYPKTWSVHVEEKNNQLTALMHPDYVPADPATSYALKIEVINSPYDRVVSSMEGAVKAGKASAEAYNLDMLPDIIGLRVDGQIDSKKEGSAIILPLRDKTIRISSEGADFIGDLDNIILANFTFNP